MGTSETPASRHGSVIRAACATALLFWMAVFVLVLIEAPPKVKLLGIGWAAMALLQPRVFLISLTLAFPLFGNNPGGPHALYLIEMGLMGFAVHDLALRVAGLRRRHPHPANPFLLLLFLVSTLALIPQWRFISCEAAFRPRRFFFTLYNHYATAPLFGARMWLDLLLGMTLFGALRDEPLAPAWRRGLWGALLGGLLISALLGLMDFAGILSLGFWRGQNPDITRFGYRRLQSLFWHSGWYAQYLSPLASAALAFGLVPGHGSQRDEKARRYRLGIAALLALTQLLTFQRGGWIGLGAGYIIVTTGVLASSGGEMRRRLVTRIAFAIVMAGIATTLLALMIPALAHRIGEIARLRDRAQIWEVGFAFFRMAPIGGIGLGNYFSTHLAVFPPDSPYYFMDKVTPHNAYLHALAERGIFGGLLTFLLLMGVPVMLWRRAVRPTAASPEPALRGEPLALLGATTALAVNCLFQDLAYVRVIDLLFWIFLGLATPYLLSPPWNERTAWRGGWVIAGVVVSVLMAWNLREYARPWMIYAPGGGAFFTGPTQVRLELPRDARRIRVPLYCADPDADASPVVFTCEFEGKKLSETAFTKGMRKSEVLELPEKRDPASKLVIRVSRAWSPYAYGITRMPIRELGVSYQRPEAVPQS